MLGQDKQNSCILLPMRTKLGSFLGAFVVWSLSCVLVLRPPWTVAHQALLSTGFLGFWAFIAVAQIQSLVGELRSHQIMVVVWPPKKKTSHQRGVWVFRGRKATAISFSTVHRRSEKAKSVGSPSLGGGVSSHRGGACNGRGVGWGVRLDTRNVLLP